MEDVQMANTFLTYLVLCKKFDACTKFFLIRVNVWTVHRDKISLQGPLKFNLSGPCREVAVRGGSTVVLSILL